MKRYRQPDAHDKLVSTSFILMALVSRAPVLNREAEKRLQAQAHRMATDMLARIYPKRPATRKRPTRP